MAETIDRVVERVSEGGNLLANLALIDVNTWETSKQVYKAWKKGVAVEGVNTANMAIYRLIDDEVVFNLLGHQGNLFVDEGFRKDTYHGIMRNEFFLPQGKMKKHVMAAINANASTEINYSGLRTKRIDCSGNYYFIESGSENTDEEKKLFNAVYGVKNPGNGRKIYLLRENVVRQQLSEKPVDLVARACYLSNNQIFYADDRNIFIYGSAVRGVLLDSAKGWYAREK